MGVISGILAAVDGVNAVRNWSISLGGELSDYAHSGTRGATGAVAGNTDWSGTMAGYGDTPPAMPGESFAFLGSMDGVSGASGTGIIDSVVINADIEGKKPIDWSANFSSNGALTLGAAVAADTSVEVPVVADHECVVSLGSVLAIPVWTELPVRRWSLNFTAANPRFVDTSTAGTVGRRKGNIALAFTIDVYTDDLADLPQPNDIKGLRFYTSATRYWEVLWGIFGEISGVTVDRETAAIVGASLNGRLRVAELVGATPTIGSITKPGAGAAWWPAA